MWETFKAILTGKCIVLSLDFRKEYQWSMIEHKELENREK